MAVFTDKSLEIFRDRLFVIHPLVDRSVTGAGYDLNIGYFVVIRNKMVLEKGEVDHLGMRGPQILMLAPRSSLLVITRENAYLSSRVAGSIHIRGSYAAQGIFMNSTTVDPNWSGQQVFLLTNAAWHDVRIDLRKHFCTMVLYDVRHQSRQSPNDTRDVLVKYLNIYQGDTGEAFEYVMRRDIYRREYEEKVERVRALNRHTDLYVRCQLMLDEIRRNLWRVAIYGAVFLMLLASLLVWRLGSRLTDKIDSDVIQGAGAIGSFVSGLVALALVLSDFRKAK